MRWINDMRLIVYCAALIGAASLLVACGDETSNSANRKGSDAAQDALPAPEARAGSVTGMPDQPGPGQSGAVSGEPPPTIVAGVEPSIDLLNPETGLLPGSADPLLTENGELLQEGAAQEPSARDAIGVIRDYYASINAHSYARAYSLWSDGGRSSGQSPQQFADGFAETVGVTAQIATPGEVDAAAGSRYITIPVAISATRGDGTVRRYDGTYTLRRAVGDGATAEQRAWRISSADLRELQP